MPHRSHRWIPAATSGLFAISAVAWLVLPGERPVTGQSVAAEANDGTAARNPSDVRPSWEPTNPDPDVDDPGQAPTGSASIDAVAVSIPRIGVDSALVPLDVDPGSGVLVPPDRFDIAGVFTGGPVPGEVGPAIIAGHVDSRDGPGVFYHLEEMLPGDRVTVTLSNGQRVDFQVVQVSQYPKTSFPTDAVYGPTPGRELRLITCGGSFDRSRRSYVDNIVVFAVRI